MGDLQLGIKITADGKTADLEFNRIRQSLGEVGKSAKSIETNLSSMASVAKSAFAAMGAAFSVKQLIETTDAYTNMNSKLKLATASADEYANAQKSLFTIAQNNKTALVETVSLYSRIAVGMRDMGASQAQVLKVVDSVGKALKVSGASTSEAASVTTQLSQALASGVLRGEEFNSVMENGPRLARAIADGLQVPIGALRQMATEGKLTSEQVIKALESQSSALSQEASSMQTTVGQAWQMLENAATSYIGQADQANGTSAELASTIELMANNFNAMVDPVAKVVTYLAQANVWAWLELADAISTIRLDLAEITGTKTNAVDPQNDPEVQRLMKLGQGQTPIDELAAKSEKAATAVATHFAKTTKTAKKGASDAEAAFKATIDANVKTAEDAARLYDAQAKTSAMRFDNERKQAEETARLEMKAAENQDQKLQIADELRKKQEALIAEETRLKEEQLVKDEAALMARINGVNLEIDAADKYNLKQSERIKLQTELQSLLSQQQALPEEKAQIQLESMAKMAEATKQFNDIRIDGETNVREEALRTLEVLSSNLEYAKEIASGLSDAFGDVGTAIGGMTVALAEYAKQQATISIQAAEDIKKNPTRKLEIEQDAMLKSSRTQIKAYGDMTQAAQGFFQKGTKGYEAMGGAVKVFRAFEMAQSVMSAVKQMEQMGGMLNFFTASLEQMGIISSVNTTKEIAQSAAKAQAKAVEGAANQGTQGDPYSAFARVAAWVALMAGLGIMISGGSGGSQSGVSAEDLKKQQEDAFKRSTATMLGSEEMSTSIRDALDLIANNSSNDLDYTKGMAADLNRLANAMDSAGAAVAKVFKIDTAKLNLGATKTSNAPGFDPISGMIWGGTKTTRELVSQGIKLVSQSLWDIIEGALVKGKTFADVLVTKKSSTLFGLLGSTSQNLETIFGKLDSTIAQALSKSFKSIYSTIGKSAELLGMSGPGLDAQINNLAIKMPRIPLGKDGKKNAENIAAALSAQADRWAEQINPALKEFQRIDEGLYGTLIRVSEGSARAKGILEQLGMTTISYSEIKEKEGDIAAEITRQVIMAQGDLSAGTRQYVNDLTGSAEDIASAYQQISNVTRLMRGAGFGTENIDREMINAAGGLSKFEEALQTFRDNFMTDQQKLTSDSEELTKAFARLGYGLPQSKDQFYAIAMGIDKTTTEGKKLFAQFLSLSGAFSDFTDAAKNLADAQAEAAQAAVDAARKAAEEAEAAARKIKQSYEDAFFTPEEKTAKQLADLKKQFDALGVSMPQSKEEFRKYLDGLNLLVPSQEALYNQLVLLAPAFASASDAAAGYAQKQEEAIRKAKEAEYEAAKKAHEEMLKTLEEASSEALSGLRDAYQNLQKTQDRFIQTSKTLKTYLLELTNLQASPERRYESAAMEFRRVSALAALGNEGAIGQLDTVGKEFLDASREYNASSLQFQADREEVIKAVTEAISFSEQQANTAKEQLIAAEKSYGALLGISTGIGNITDGVISVAQGVNNMITAMNNYQAAIAALAAGKAAAPVAPTPVPVPAPVVQPIPMPKPVPISTAPQVPGGRMGYNPFQDETYQILNEDYSRRMIRFYYQQLLGREPENEGAYTGRLAQLMGGHITADELAYQFRQSAEYKDLLAKGFIPGFAQGGLASEGIAMVGEKGPELVRFSRPGMVYTANQTKEMLAGNNNSEKLDAVTDAVSAGIRVDQAGYQGLMKILTSIDDRLSSVESANKLAGAVA